MAAAEIKGSTFKFRLQFVRSGWGESALGRVLARLPAEEAEIVRNTLPIGWYPLALNARLDEAIANELVDGDERFYEQLGEYSADSFAREIYSSYYDDRRPEAFIRGSVDLYHRYYRNCGTRRNELPSPGLAFVIVEGAGETYRSNCLSNIGFVRRSLSIVGAKGVEVKEMGCVALGAVECRWRVRWTP